MFLCFYVGYGEDVYVEKSPMVNHIENNLKRPVVLMIVKSEWSNPKRLVIFY